MDTHKHRRGRMQTHAQNTHTHKSGYAILTCTNIHKRALTVSQTSTFMYPHTLNYTHTHARLCTLVFIYTQTYSSTH